MNDFMTYFLAGFADDQATKITKRKNEAEDYFNKQMELARTRGLESREKNKVAMNQGITSAKQLMQMGAPQDLVMALANQNPDDLNSFAKQIAQAQMDGIETDEQFFRDLMQVSGELNTGSKDLVSLFGEIYEPLRNNVKSNPEGYKNDKRGTLWATMMGHNAMDRAMDKLETTEIADGYTAAELLASERRAEGDYNRPLGDATVTLDYGKLGDATRRAKADNKISGPPKPISITETTAVVKQFETIKDSIRAKAGITADGEWNEQDEAGINQQAAEQIIELYGENADKILQIPEIAQYLTSDGAPPAPAAPTTSTLQLQGGETFVEDKGDGTSIWRSRDGQLKRYKNDELKKYGYNVGG